MQMSITKSKKYYHLNVPKVTEIFLGILTDLISLPYIFHCPRKI